METVKQLKKRRRNTGYATSSRQCKLKKRVQLDLQVQDLKQEVIRLMKELEYKKATAD